MDARTFHAGRRFAETPFGRIAYFERGSGPVALFIHGAPLNGFFWRDVIEELSPIRRCIAPDTMGLGYTEIPPGQDVSFGNQARMIESFLDALGIDQVDLVGNDSGGGISQIFAAHHPERVRSLTLTNCEVHDRWPGPAFEAIADGMRSGAIIDVMREMMKDVSLARAETAFGLTYADPATLTEESLRTYLEPLLSSSDRVEALRRFFLSSGPEQTVAVESLLRRLEVPTLLIWGCADVFFDVESAHWLRDAIPGVRALLEVPGGRLFFPEENPGLLAASLRSFWSAPSARVAESGHGAAAFVRSFAEAWAHPDPDRFVALLDPAVRLLQPMSDPVVGREAAREWFRGLLDMDPEIHGEVTRWSASGDAVFIEWTLSAALGGTRRTWPLVDRFLLEGGLARERVAYFDSAPLLAPPAEGT